MKPPSLNIQPHHAALCAILALGLLLHVAYLAEARRAPDFDSPVLDPQLNDYWARALVTGDWTPPPHADDPEIRTTPYGRPPGYPWLLAVMYWVSNGSYLAPRLFQLAAGMLNILLVYLLGRRLSGVQTGLAAALLMAAFWGGVYFTFELNSPVWEVFTSLSMLLLLLRWRDTRSWPWLAAAGVLLGLGALMRPNVLLVGVFLLFWIARQAALHRRAVRAVGGSVLLFATAVVLVTAPVLVRNWVVSGDFVLISYYGGINAYIGNNPEAEGTSPTVPDLYEISGVDQWNCFNYPGIVRGLERRLDQTDLGFAGTSRYFYNRALAFWRDAPLHALGLTLRKTWFFWGPHEISDSKVVHHERLHARMLRWLPTFTPLLALALTGLLAAGLLRNTGSVPDRQVALLAGCFCLGYFLSIVPFFIAERYRFPVMPVLLPFAGHALHLAWEQGRRRRLAVSFAILCAWGVIYVAAALPLLPYTPSLTTWRLHRGIAHAARGRTDAAAAELNQALQADPHNDEAHLHLGYIYAGRGRQETAMDHYRRALETNPRNVLAANNLGYEHYLQGDDDEAERYFRLALERNPAFPLALNNLGNVLLRRGDYDGALRRFEKALEVNPCDPFARYNMGNVYLERGAYARAAEAYETAFEEQPANPDIANNLGLALALDGQLDASIPWFEKALSLAERYPLAHYNLGNVYGDLGAIDKACHHYDAVLAAWPDHEEAAKRRGMLCEEE